MRVHPEWLREYARRHGCRREYHWFGYDMVCDGRKVLLRQLNRDCSVSLSYLVVREAERFKPDLVVVDGELNELVRLSFKDWYGMLFGFEEKQIFLVPWGCTLRLQLKQGNRGKEIRIYVSEDTYKKWTELVKRKKMNWEDILLLMMRYV